jgi:hypothetical protein
VADETLVFIEHMTAYRHGQSYRLVGTLPECGSGDYCPDPFSAPVRDVP